MNFFKMTYLSCVESINLRSNTHNARFVRFDDVDGSVPGPDAAATVVEDTKTIETARSTSDPIAMLVASVATKLRPDKQRASELRGILASGFVGVARRVWPGLRSVRMLATGAFAVHARLLADTYLQGVPQLSLVHAGSEGFYGVNVAAAEDEEPKSLGFNSRYTVLPQLGFYEFIPLADVEQTQSATLFADQVIRFNPLKVYLGPIFVILRTQSRHFEPNHSITRVISKNLKQYGQSIARLRRPYQT